MKFRICVHIRRGDFVTDGQHAGTEKEFTKNAIDFLYKLSEFSNKKLSGAPLTRFWPLNLEKSGEKLSFFTRNQISKNAAKTRQTLPKGDGVIWKIWKYGKAGAPLTRFPKTCVFWNHDFRVLLYDLSTRSTRNLNFEIFQVVTSRHAFFEKLQLIYVKTSKIKKKNPIKLQKMNFWLVHEEYTKTNKWIFLEISEQVLSNMLILNIIVIFSGNFRKIFFQPPVQSSSSAMNKNGFARKL